MCGRSCLSLDKNQLQCACSYKPRGSQLFEKPIWLEEHNDGRDYIPSHNIAPTDITPILLSGCKYKNAVPHERVLKPMMWGIIPPWHKGDYRSHNMSTNNCRLENIRSSKLYNPILKSGGRCIVVVEGFYEWQTTSKLSKVKKPYYIYAVQREGVKIDEPNNTWNNEFSDCHGWNGITLLHMAGLYSIWQNDNIVIYSYSIITMEANNKMDWLHHRMPAILHRKEQIDAWLDIENVDPEMALGYLKPIEVLSWHEVSSLVNNSRNKSDECNKLSEQTKKNKNTQKTLSGWIVKNKKKEFVVDAASPEPKKLKQ